MKYKTQNPNAIKNPTKWIFYACMVALPLTHFAIFYIYVNFNSILMAFQTYDRATGSFVFGNTGFKNFAQIFVTLKETVYMPSAFKNSLIKYLCSFFFGTVFSITFAWYVYKKKTGAWLFRVILYLPSIISSVTLVTMFRYFSELAIPELVKTITGIEIQGLLYNQETTFGTILFFSIWMTFGGGLLMYGGTMSSISDSIIEAAEVDGVTPFKEFILIVVPMIWPTITTFMVSAAAGIFTDQMNLFTFYDTKAEFQLYTVGYYMYRQIKYSGTEYSEYPFLAAFGLGLTLITMPYVFFLRWFMNKVNPLAD